MDPMDPSVYLLLIFISLLLVAFLIFALNGWRIRQISKKARAVILMVLTVSLIQVGMTLYYVELNTRLTRAAAQGDFAKVRTVLRPVVTVVQQKIRNRDRLYRIAGDGFAIVCPDLSAQEAQGMIARVALSLKEKPVSSAGTDGSKPPVVTLSVGITEWVDQSQIKNAFDRADKEAIRSKALGRDRITLSNGK